MSQRFRARPSKLLAAAIATAVFAASVMLASAAIAADPPPAPQSIGDVIQQMANSPVFESECTALCHANISDTKNYTGEIKFTHGNHILLQCGDCHPRFPHRLSGTEKPKMQGCFDCHGVYHGPKGLLGKANCEACHNTPRGQLRPAFHTNDWAEKPHVKPAKDELNTKCMMCHTIPSCVECHVQKGVKWQPKSWEYDPSGWGGDGKPSCLTCHGNATLLKTVGGTNKSFQVSGVEDSAHNTLTCQQCHPDFNYDNKPQATKMWNVNAGVQCGTCHQNAEKEKDRAPVALYDKSVHAAKIREGNYDSATCASCHGGHFIARLDSAEASEAMHASAYRTCARCKQHGEAYATYNDYYHGRAYKKGAADAPACWQCHNSHDILPQNNPKSSVYQANLGKTCGRPGCHSGSTEQFGNAAGKLIHQKVQAQKDNPVLQFIANIRGMIGGN